MNFDTQEAVAHGKQLRQEALGQLMDAGRVDDHNRALTQSRLSNSRDTHRCVLVVCSVPMRVFSTKCSFWLRCTSISPFHCLQFLCLSCFCVLHFHRHLPAVASWLPRQRCLDCIPNTRAKPKAKTGVNARFLSFWDNI